MGKHVKRCQNYVECQTTQSTCQKFVYTLYTCITVLVIHKEKKAIVKSWDQGAQNCGTVAVYPWFLWYEVTGSISTWHKISVLSSYPPVLLTFWGKLTGTHLYSWVERVTVRLTSFVQELNTGIEPGLESLYSESTRLTTLPSYHHTNKQTNKQIPNLKLNKCDVMTYVPWQRLLELHFALQSDIKCNELIKLSITYK